MVSTTDLFKAYQNWCAQNNVRAFSNIVFGREMRARGFDVYRTKKARFLIGINLEHAECYLLTLIQGFYYRFI